LKARFCALGFEQIEGIDFDETFAPVVNWITVRFLLMMSILLGLETKQVDYVAALHRQYCIRRDAKRLRSTRLSAKAQKVTLWVETKPKKSFHKLVQQAENSRF
jgi:hypothetical protein